MKMTFIEEAYYKTFGVCPHRFNCSGFMLYDCCGSDCFDDNPLDYPDFDDPDFIG